MPPTSSSGLVSNFCHKSRKQAIQLWEDGPQKYFKTGKPKSSSEILCPSQKIRWRAGRLKGLVLWAAGRSGWWHSLLNRRFWRVVNIVSWKALRAHLNQQGRLSHVKVELSPGLASLRHLTLGQLCGSGALWSLAASPPDSSNLSAWLTFPAFFCHFKLWLAAI